MRLQTALGAALLLAVIQPGPAWADAPASSGANPAPSGGETPDVSDKTAPKTPLMHIPAPRAPQVPIMPPSVPANQPFTRRPPSAMPPSLPPSLPLSAPHGSGGNQPSGGGAHF